MDSRLILPYLIAERAEQCGDRVILRDVEGRSRTYAELHEAAGRWAGVLERLDGAEARIASMLPTSLQAHEIWLGTTWQKSVEVPINTSYRGQMLRHVLSDSKAPILIIDRQYVERLQALERIETLRNIVIIGDKTDVNLPYRVHWASDLLRQDAIGRLAPDIKTYDIGLVLYTSGTTGASKGVLMPWAQLFGYVTSWMPILNGTMGEEDVLYSTMPMAHTSGRLPVYTAALLNGEVVLREFFSATVFWEDIEKFKCTTTFLLGGTGQILYGRPPRDTDGQTTLRNVTMIPLVADVEDFKKRFGVRVYTLFGSTEAGVVLHSADDWTLQDSRSCGRAHPGCEVRLVDENDMEVGPGEVGELILRPRDPWTIMSGYLDDPEKTLKAFRNLWFHTGDGFMRDEDGNYYFVDRLKDVIRRRGENISSMEVEREVLAHPDVLDCCAIAVSSELGEDEVMVVVQPKAGGKVEPLGLLQFLLPRMPYFMVPRFVEEMAELPRTETAKVKKGELRARGVTASTWDREKAGVKVNRLS